MYFTRQQIKDAIIWMKAQTQDNTISNTFLGDLLDSMVDETPDFGNMTDIEVRMLKNKLDSIVTGNVSLSQIPNEFPLNEIPVRFTQTGYEDQIVTMLKTKYVYQWLYGKATYEGFLDVALPSTPPSNTAGHYWALSLPDNQYLLFGGTLGGLPAGFSLGKSEAGFQVQLSTSNNGQNYTKEPVKISMIDQTGGAVPLNFSIMNWGLLREELPSGIQTSVVYLSPQNVLNPEWYIKAEDANNGNQYKIPIWMEIVIRVNGIEKPEYTQQFQKDQNYYTFPNRNGMYIGNINPLDEVDVIFREYDPIS